MQNKHDMEAVPVSKRLRPLVYVYAAINIAVVTLLLSTVSPTLPVQASSQVADLR